MLPRFHRHHMHESHIGAEGARQDGGACNCRPALRQQIGSDHDVRVFHAANVGDPARKDNSVDPVRAGRADIGWSYFSSSSETTFPFEPSILILCDVPSSSTVSTVYSR